jgi:phytoene/squalene synthetase
MLPADLLSTHKISSESIIRRTAADDDKFKHVVQALAARAEEHLVTLLKYKIVLYQCLV